MYETFSYITKVWSSEMGSGVSDSFGRTHNCFIVGVVQALSPVEIAVLGKAPSSLLFKFMLFDFKCTFQ